MSKIKYALFILLVALSFTDSIAQNAAETKKVKKLKIDELRNWQNLDLQQDSVPGISLNRLYNEFIKNKKGKEIIVAVIDSYIDLNHEDLKNQIWINKKEIPNNNIDDDKNGYVDDTNGWNFLGNKSGESTFRLNYDAARRLRNLLRKNVDTTNFNGNTIDSLAYRYIQKEFQKLKVKHNSKIEDAKYYQDAYISSFKRIDNIFNNKPFSLKQIDSLFKLREFDATDELYYDMYFVRDFIKTNNNKAWIDLFEERVVGELSTSLNANFNENDIIKDIETNIKDKNYGNNKVSHYSNKTWHSTMMSGMIAANRKNNVGIQGFGNQIKVMPLVISAASGTHRDKDIALAIEYAVNNGAKVINMSFGKSTPIYPEWIQKSILYAKENDVLIVVSAGNSNENLDAKYSYPNDYFSEKDVEEFVDNLIVVGGINHEANENLVYKYSNFGKKNVDIMAPATDIWCLDPIRNYALDDGTSFAAALTSGSAALIRSHYPKLTANQVKNIILESGVTIDQKVIKPGTDNEMVPFSVLCKSGKILNVYNAMKMAKEVSKKKK
ncbi:S8 family serine peptidase [Flavobacterium sp.]|jgi:subtilisin family serine protease|uniref:S8 family serine peptidase n=1 Tax=Flavobacterium sp. TaxID=239 RepID=UPI0037BEB23B